MHVQFNSLKKKEKKLIKEHKKTGMKKKGKKFLFSKNIEKALKIGSFP